MNDCGDSEERRRLISNGKIFHLFDIPYESEDEFGELLDENNLSDEQLFSQLDDVLRYAEDNNEFISSTSGDTPADNRNENHLNVSTIPSVSKKQNSNFKGAKPRKKKRPPQKWIKGSLEVHENDKEFKVADLEVSRGTLAASGSKPVALCE
ncbi:hypothetical protein J6590_032228 [Homalodisca vitripennis]|nr:hypothetical protein J6590_032228 [Homalodisca vitripennis]